MSGESSNSSISPSQSRKSNDEGRERERGRERGEGRRGRGAVIYNTGCEELISDKVMTEGTDSATYDRSQAMIESIQNDPLAYQSPPAGML